MNTMGMLRRTGRRLCPALVCPAGHLATLLAAGLLVAGWATNVAAQEAATPFAGSGDTAAGENLFRVHCGRCHGRDARGGRGPDLTTGRILARGDAGLFEIIADGIPGTEMPPLHRTRSDKAVWQLVAYLRALNQAPEDASLPGDASAGEALYNGKGACDSCHMVEGVGGRLGPDLSRIGERRAPDALKADLLQPQQEVQPRWWSMRVVHVDGTRVEELRMNEDTYSVRIMDGDENLWSFAKLDLGENERVEASTMPSYSGELSAAEVDDLVAYLFSLRRTERRP